MTGHFWEDQQAYSHLLYHSISRLGKHSPAELYWLPIQPQSLTGVSTMNYGKPQALTEEWQDLSASLASH